MSEDALGNKGREGEAKLWRALQVRTKEFALNADRNEKPLGI